MASCFDAFPAGLFDGFSLVFRRAISKMRLVADVADT